MQELFNIFEAMEYPYFRQGSMTDVEYPTSFFTFWNYDTPEHSFYDDESKCYVENVMVYFYTKNPNKIYNTMEEFITAAKAAGLKTMGKAYDCPADKENYFGRLVRVKIIHKEE